MVNIGQVLNEIQVELNVNPEERTAGYHYHCHRRVVPTMSPSVTQSLLQNHWCLEGKGVARWPSSTAWQVTMTFQPDIRRCG